MTAPAGYTPLRRGEWPTDRAAGKAEFRNRFADFVEDVERIRAWAGFGATLKVLGVVNVLGDEWGDVDDQMRAALLRREDETAPAPAPQPYRGKR